MPLIEGNRTKAGIDYGNGLTNIDKETGIRYGVIPQNDVFKAWDEQSEPHYGGSESGEDGEDCCNDFNDPICYELNDGKYIAAIGADETDIFIIKSPFYTFAKFCSPCAPGAGHLSNVADIDGKPLNETNGVQSFCFAPDWFNYQSHDGKSVTGEYNGQPTSCPYPVYRVDDTKCVFMPVMKK